MKQIQSLMPTFFGFWRHRKKLFFATRFWVSIYAFLLVILSFKLFELPLPWPTILLTSLSFSLLSASIQIVNDYHDRKNDQKKGKVFAANNASLILNFWLIINLATAGLLMAVYLISPKLSIFCLLIWLLGISYSFVQKILIVQNLIVAICGGLPILSGGVFYGRLELKSLFIFTILLAIIFVREIVKDIEDRKIDAGHKNTIPVITAQKIRSNNHIGPIKNPYFTIEHPIKKMFPDFDPEIFPSFDIAAKIIGRTSLICLLLGGWGFVTFFGMIGIIIMLALVLNRPDHYIQTAKQFINLIIAMLVLSIFIDKI